MRRFVMNRPRLLLVVFPPLALLGLLVVPSIPAAANEVEQHLRDEYQGKTLVLRGFYSADRLHYDSTGKPDNAASGDWTVNGFVRVGEIHLSGDRLVIKAQRLTVVRPERKELELSPRLRGSAGRRTIENVQVEIKADTGHNPSPEQADAVAAEIFLTTKDSLADLVPDYWKPCVRQGLKRDGEDCSFAAEILFVPGVAAAALQESSENAAAGGESRHRMLRVGNGITPPHITDRQEPEYSESARAARYQGTVVLMLGVNKEGAPTSLRISQPLGCGLDEKAVQAVKNWKFAPAEKDGVPVDLEIAVEVDFHLY
jgi:TonB family protein